jgi:hypothetical protein
MINGLVEPFQDPVHKQDVVIYANKSDASTDAFVEHCAFS